MRTYSRKGLLPISAIALVVALTGCAENTSSDRVSPTTSATGAPTANMVAPEIIELADIQNGSLGDVRVEVGQTVVVSVPDPGNTDVTSSDPAVVVVELGGLEGDAVINPSFSGISVGEAKVVLTTSSGTKTTLNVTVVEQ